MAKVIRHLRSEQREFQKIFSGLADRRSAWQAWADFVDCAAIAISNAFDRVSKDSEAREKRYAEIMKSYNKAERVCFSQLIALMSDALEQNPEQDFLGEMFMAMELGNHWKGQFFTPYDVCRAMAAMQIGCTEASVERRGWVGIMDPACGAGALLIAARNEFMLKGVGYRQALFVCQDIDHVAGLMCYIQLSLLGCAGYIVIADTFMNPISGPSPLLPIIKPGQDFWFTPAFYDEVWQERIRFEHVMRAIEKLMEKPAEAVATPAASDEKAAPCVDIIQEPPATEGQETPLELTADETGQLSFF